MHAGQVTSSRSLDTIRLENTRLPHRVSAMYHQPLSFDDLAKRSKR